MTDHIENERRIDSEFHYARANENLSAMAFYRKTDGVFVEAKSFGRPITEVELAELLDDLDATARHWIEHTQAQNQEVRELAAALLDVRSRIGDFTLSEQRDRFDRAAAKLTAALSNNPQVSEPSEAAEEQAIVVDWHNNGDGRAYIAVGDEAFYFEDADDDTPIIEAIRYVGSRAFISGVTYRPAAKPNPIPEGEGERDA